MAVPALLTLVALALCAFASASASASTSSEAFPVLILQGSNGVELAADRTATASAMTLDDFSQVLDQIPCDGVILVVDAPGATHLEEYGNSMPYLKKFIANTEHALTLPSVSVPSSTIVKESIETRCGLKARGMDGLNTPPMLLITAEKGLYAGMLAPLTTGTADVKKAMRANDGTLKGWIIKAGDPTLIIVGSNGVEKLDRRSASHSTKNATITRGGVVISPGLFEGFVVVVLVGLITVLGVGALASVQSVTRFEGKGDAKAK
ncbi:hypothetical protein HK101_001061 [Irineochytrium annulatum]|nr:hypothetical protein HK101_001061 [Irineochytrium annulatum]